MSRAQQPSRPNVPPPLPHHHRQQQQQLQQGEYYYEQDVPSEEYIGDYIDGSECVPNTAPVPIMAGERRQDVTELYNRRRCNSAAMHAGLGLQGAASSTAELYPQAVYLPVAQQQQQQQQQSPEYFYDPRMASANNLQSNSQQPQSPPIRQSQTAPPQIQPLPTVYRKRNVVQPQQTRYLTNEEAYHLQRQQHQQRQHMQQQMHMQQLHQQHHKQHLQQQQQQHQQEQQEQEIYQHPHQSMQQVAATQSPVTHHRAARQAQPQHIMEQMDVGNVGQVVNVAVEGVAQPQQVIRRHPVTVRTPRYIRRPVNSNLYKRPSALCLPIAVQPDPGFYSRKVKRAPAHNVPVTVSQVHHQHPADGMNLPEMNDLDQIPLEAAYNQPEMYMTQTKHNKIPMQQSIQMQTMPIQQTGLPMTMPLLLNAAPDVPSTHQQPPQQKQQQCANNSNMSSIPTTVSSIPQIPSVPETTNANAASTKSRLDAILQRYDRLFRNTGEKNAFDNDKGDQDDAKQLKPRTPPSLKELVGSDTKKTKESTQQTPKTNIPDMMKTAETLQVEEMTTDMLDELLSELTENGFNDVVDEDGKKKIKEKVRKKLAITQEPIIEKNEDPFNKDIPLKDLPKSFNYSEIKDSMSKSKVEYCESGTSHTNTMINELTSKKSETTTIRSKSKIIPRILVDDAMELHRTKSYVVNLIDTALSNHFGTTVGHHSNKKSKKTQNMDAKSAVEMLKKQSSTTSSKPSNKDLADEIAQVLTDSMGSNSRHSDVSKGLSECSCKSQQLPHEEPMFVKQLRQMRWGHLKHIQQEVRRLEELERFLDSCNMSTFEKCHFH